MGVKRAPVFVNARKHVHFAINFSCIQLGSARIKMTTRHKNPFASAYNVNKHLVDTEQHESINTKPASSHMHLFFDKIDLIENLKQHEGVE